jgi:hypothetical protein
MLALLETDVACCTFHVDDGDAIRSIDNAKKQEERSLLQQVPACNLTMRLPAMLARRAGSTTQGLKSRLCAANQKDDFESSKDRRK